jgi:hypothetical protein
LVVDIGYLVAAQTTTNSSKDFVGMYNLAVLAGIDTSEELVAGKSDKDNLFLAYDNDTGDL